VTLQHKQVFTCMALFDRSVSDARLATHCDPPFMHEQAEEVEASISGSIPNWIRGHIIANGGGDFTGEIALM